MIFRTNVPYGTLSSPESFSILPFGSTYNFTSMVTVDATHKSKTAALHMHVCARLRDCCIRPWSRPFACSLSTGFAGRTGASRMHSTGIISAPASSSIAKSSTTVSRLDALDKQWTVTVQCVQPSKPIVDQLFTKLIIPVCIAHSFK